MKRMQIKPPQGTDYGTRHVLKNIFGGETVFEWNIGRQREAWFTPGTRFGTTPEGMATAGWRYSRKEESENQP